MASAPRRGPAVRFDRIQPMRAHESVAEQIRRHIALRLVRPGETLPSERELAEMFRVGRPTIQQALRLLEAHRLVEPRRGRHGGTFVRGPGQDSETMDGLITKLLVHSDELEELLVYRRVVEPAVTCYAAERRRKSDLDRMSRAMRGLQDATIESDVMRCDTEFHLAIAAATDNAHLMRCMEQVRFELNDALSLLPESDRWHRRIASEHEAIYEAVAARDAGTAEEAATAHAVNSAQGVRAVLAAIRRQRFNKVGD
jgi:DNA-binding FadR family transcriptional regulator